MIIPTNSTHDNYFQPKRQFCKLRQHINVLFRLLSMCNNINQNCLTVISGCNNLPILKLCPHPFYFTGGVGASDSPVSLFSLSVSVSISLFCSQLASIRCLMLYSVAYLQTGILMILALQRCFPQVPAPACSSTQRAIKTQGGLVLCA